MKRRSGGERGGEMKKALLPQGTQLWPTKHATEMHYIIISLPWCIDDDDDDGVYVCVCVFVCVCVCVCV